MELLVIGLGTNLGERENNLEQARHRLEHVWNTPKFSSIYETLPWGIAQQPLFLNQVGMGFTEIPPLDILQIVKRIESDMGRELGPRNGPRIIDLDILYYGQWTLFSSLLTIPHPRLAERAFTLVPLVELVPDLPHPVKKMTNRQLLTSLDPSEESCKLFNTADREAQP